MIYVNFGGIRDPLKQNLALQFCRNRNKDVSILTETHINLDQIHQIKNNWLGTIFFSPGDSHIKGLLVLLNLGLEGATKVDTDPKGFVSFKVTPSNEGFPCVYAPSGHRTRDQLAGGYFFEGLQNYMKNKNEGNENNIILGDFNCTMDKMTNDARNKTLYRCRFNYALSNLLVDHGLEDLWRRGNLNSSEFTSYDRSSGTSIDRAYTYIKIANNTKINYTVSFTDHYNATSIDRFPSKWYFNNSLLCKPKFP